MTVREFVESELINQYNHMQLRTYYSSDAILLGPIKIHDYMMKRSLREKYDDLEIASIYISIFKNVGMDMYDAVYIIQVMNED